MALLSLYNAKDSTAFVLIKKEMRSRELLCQLDSENLNVASKVCMLIVYWLFLITEYLIEYFIYCIFISCKHNKSNREVMPQAEAHNEQENPHLPINDSTQNGKF